MTPYGIMLCYGKYYKFWFLSVILGITVAACGDNSNTVTTPAAGDPSPPVTLPEPSPGTEPKNTISFIHLNDLHAHLVAHWEQVRPDASSGVLAARRGGLARIATKIKQIRLANPNTVLLNVGDTYHGGAEAMFSVGNAIVAPVDLLSVDIGVPGNWDFAYGPVVTNARYGNLSHSEVLRPNYKVLAANASYKVPDNITATVARNTVQRVFNYQAGDPFLDPTYVIERNNIKIGFIGLTSDIVAMMHPMMAFNIEFTQGKSAYLELIQQHANALQQQQVNLIVVLSELGIHKDLDLANSLPKGSVDVFFSAHTHELTEKAITSDSGALVVESGNDTYIGQLDVDFSTRNKAINFHWKIHAITDDIVEDPEMLAAVKAARSPYVEANPQLSIPMITPQDAGIISRFMPTPFTQQLTRSINEVITRTSIPLDRRHVLENNFNNAYTDMLRQSTGADIAITPGFRFDSSVIPNANDYTGDPNNYYWMSEDNAILNGEISVADIYRFIPAPYFLAKGTTNGKHLKEVIEQNLNAVFSPAIFEQGGGWTDGFSGIDMTINLSNPQGSRIIDINYSDSGQPLLDTDFVTVAGCARPMDSEALTTLCSYPGFDNVVALTDPLSPVNNWAATDFLIQAIENGELENVVSRTNIHDISNTPVWPDQTFYQPLTGVTTLP